MKRIILTLALLISGVSMASAQFYNLDQKIGTKYEYETIGEKSGKSSMIMTVKAIEGNRLIINSFIEIPGEAPAVDAEFEFTVEDNKATQGMEGLVESTRQHIRNLMGGRDVEVKIEGDETVQYLAGSVGDTFPLTQSNITMTTMGFTMEMGMKTIKCEVIAEEEIKTPAGTFQTIVIEEVIENEFRAGGQTEVSTSTTKSWIATGKGLIKQETEGDDEVSTTTLIKITNS